MNRRSLLRACAIALASLPLYGIRAASRKPLLPRGDEIEVEATLYRSDGATAKGLVWWSPDTGHMRVACDRTAKLLTSDGCVSIRADVPYSAIPIRSFSMPIKDGGYIQ